MLRIAILSLFVASAHAAAAKMSDSVNSMCWQLQFDDSSPDSSERNKCANDVERLSKSESFKWFDDQDSALKDTFGGCALRKYDSKPNDWMPSSERKDCWEYTLATFIEGDWRVTEMYEQCVRTRYGQKPGSETDAAWNKCWAAAIDVARQGPAWIEAMFVGCTSQRFDRQPDKEWISPRDREFCWDQATNIRLQASQSLEGVFNECTWQKYWLNDWQLNDSQRQECWQYTLSNLKLVPVSASKLSSTCLLDRFDTQRTQWASDQDRSTCWTFATEHLKKSSESYDVAFQACALRTTQEGQYMSDYLRQTCWSEALDTVGAYTRRLVSIPVMVAVMLLVALLGRTWRQSFTVRATVKNEFVELQA